MSLVAHFLFHGSAKDEIGTYNGTATDIAYETAPEDKNFGSGVAVFNGSTSNILMPSSSLFTGNWSFEAWLKNTNGGAANSKWILGINPNRNNNISDNWNDSSLRQMNTGVYHLYYSGGGTVRSTTSAFTDGEWHHLVWTFNKSSSYALAVYVDGKQQTLDTSTFASLGSYSNYWRLGARVQITENPSGKWQGKMANVRLYNEVLTAATVAEHYNSESRPVTSTNFLEPFYSRNRKPLRYFTEGGGGVRVLEGSK